MTSTGMLAGQGQVDNLFERRLQLVPGPAAALRSGPADRLSGTLRRDTICGLPGPDVIVARAGDDTISGGSGPDTIRPGAGRDVVSGDEGRDRIYARDGQRDAIDCGPFLDTVCADELDRLVGCERVRRR